MSISKTFDKTYTVLIVVFISPLSIPPIWLKKISAK